MTRLSIASRWRKAAAIALTLGLVAGCGMSPMRTGADPAEVSRLKAQAERSTTGLVNVVVTHGTAKNLSELVSAGFDVWGVEGKRVKGSANAASLETIQRLNLPVESFRSLGNSFDKGYKTTEQIEADLKALAAKYPDMTKLEDFGDSWEKTQGKTGHDLFVLKIGRGNTASKPGVIFLGNHHAREIVTPEIVLNIAHMLLEGYGKDPEITAYVDSRDIWLAPTVNPDGHVHAEQGANQRKNTNVVTGGKRRIGVDLNRNYGYKWNNGGASSDPENDTFMGVSAFSEPETQAIKQLVGSRKFAFLMTYHSFSNLILWP
ncbi:MAG TPA: M14 family zinc carboxypeptidase, partial [Pantanalinema sp.]